MLNFIKVVFKIFFDGQNCGTARAGRTRSFSFNFDLGHMTKAEYSKKIAIFLRNVNKKIGQFLCH